MATKGKSKWEDEDEDEDEDAEVAAQRKKEKEKKKQAREERLRKAEAQAAAANEAIEGPVERRGASEEPAAETASASRRKEGRRLVFPNQGFGPCGKVDGFERLNDIEEGSYGLVSRARERASGTVVALKKLKMDFANDGFPVTGLREIQTLTAAQHPHIVCLREVVMGTTLKDIYLVMDFVEHDLKTLLDELAEPFLPSEVKTLMVQMVSATEYLHAHWILHRDLKTSNILMNNRGEIKVADFGMARYTASPTPKLTQLVVTLWYRSPELLLGQSTYGFEIDLWSLGCIFGELLTRDPLFQGKNEVDQLSKIFDKLGTPTRESWPGFRSLPHAKALRPLLDQRARKEASLQQSLPASHLSTAGFRLLRSLLSLDPAARPTAGQVLQDGYFQHEAPRPKDKQFFPTFPSKAGREKRRRRETPNAPVAGAGAVPRFDAEDFARGVLGSIGLQGDEGGSDAVEEAGAGFTLRLA